METTESLFKGYWMVTNRCNLRCDYCVLENKYHQLKQELPLQDKKDLISHLYHVLGFRRLTLSGGEVLIIGKSPPNDFIELLRHIRQFKSNDSKKNLEIEVYTNGTYLNDSVAKEMEGVVDCIAITIDTKSNDLLTQIGRNTKRFPGYYDNISRICQLMSKYNIRMKLHSVVGQLNHEILPNEVKEIWDHIEKNKGPVDYWKFYQYMSYDMPSKDAAHTISPTAYSYFQQKVEKALAGVSVKLHFKDNEEMNASLFNILSYGNAQYMRDHDTWSTSQRTGDLRSYSSIQDLFAKHDINEERFRHFHEIHR